MSIFTGSIKHQEEEMTIVLKGLMDNDANFVKPLSEFWKGSTKEETFTVGHYGLWLSGEGGSMFNGEYAANYYDRNLSGGHKKLKDFMKVYGLKLIWHDCATPILLYENDMI